jgi:hypothetical protein
MDLPAAVKHGAARRVCGSARGICIGSEFGIGLSFTPGELSRPGWGCDFANKFAWWPSFLSVRPCG